MTETARWASRSTAAGAPGRGVGAEAARRALVVHSETSLAGPPLVLELVPAANVAAGEHDHGLGSLWPGATSVRLTGATEPAELLADHPDREVVVVLRDAARHEWQARFARVLLELRPGAVVVETGLPGGLSAAIETAGAGRVNLEAARERLSRSRQPARSR